MEEFDKMFNQPQVDPFHGFLNGEGLLLRTAPESMERSPIVESSTLQRTFSGGFCLGLNANVNGGIPLSAGL